MYTPRTLFPLPLARQTTSLNGNNTQILHHGRGSVCNALDWTDSTTLTQALRNTSGSPHCQSNHFDFYLNFFFLDSHQKALPRQDLSLNMGTKQCVLSKYEYLVSSLPEESMYIYIHLPSDIEVSPIDIVAVQDSILIPINISSIIHLLYNS